MRQEKTSKLLSVSQRIVLFGLALLLIIAAPFLGPIAVSPQDVFFSVDSSVSTIFWELRLPRTLLAFLAGGGLSYAGMVFQAVFQNALATPYTLGVASGASLGAVLCLLFAFGGIVGTTLGAFAGAALTVGLVYLLGVRFGQGQKAMMLLIGVSLNLFFSSLVLFLQYLADYNQSFLVVRWLMGGLETVGYEAVLRVLPGYCLGILLIYPRQHGLNLLSLGEDFAHDLGLSVQRSRTLFFLGSSVLVAGIVAVTGPIGFVGLIIPHLCRALVGPKMQDLGPACIVFGGAFLVCCDIVSRILIAPAEIPVGVITSLIGGPFFIWILLRQKA